jgi:hypothetical protein
MEKWHGHFPDQALDALVQRKPWGDDIKRQGDRIKKLSGFDRDQGK